MHTRTRLLCTALLAVAGMSLAQAAPIVDPGNPAAPGNGKVLELEYDYCSPDGDRITGFARCDRRNDRGPQLGLPPGDERQDWEDWQLELQPPGESISISRVGVPEPATLALLGLGLLGLAFRRFRRTTAQ